MKRKLLCGIVFAVFMVGVVLVLGNYFGIPQLASFAAQKDVQVHEKNEVQDIQINENVVVHATEVKVSEVKESTSISYIIGDTHVYLCSSAEEFTKFVNELDKSKYEIVSCEVSKDSNEKALLIYKNKPSHQ